MEIVIGKQRFNQAAAFSLREATFVQERGIARDIEFDDKDTDQMVYAVGYQTPSEPVVTLRIEPLSPTKVRFGRVCTLKAYRGHGLGKQLLLAAEAYMQSQGAISGEIHGELTAAGFYERLGYQKTNQQYYEDGAEVVVLTKQFKA